MYTFIETDYQNPDYVMLVNELDATLALRDGKAHAFYAPQNTSNQLQVIIVALHNGKPVACGAFKFHKPEVAEIKRMFVLPSHRKKGLATAILAHLEKRCLKQNYKVCVLETGLNQPEAIALYRKAGYNEIQPFPPYENAPLSICFSKTLLA